MKLIYGRTILMPHCIIEYTRNVEDQIKISKLVEVAYEGVVSSGIFNPKAIKVRAIPFEFYKSGLERSDYIHVKLRILSGRTIEQKKEISDYMIECIKPHIGQTKSLTLEVIDMDIRSYGKYINEST